jgi:hypothetical protein
VEVTIHDGGLQVNEGRPWGTLDDILGDGDCRRRCNRPRGCQPADARPRGPTMPSHPSSEAGFPSSAPGNAGPSTFDSTPIASSRKGSWIVRASLERDHFSGEERTDTDRTLWCPPELSGRELGMVSPELPAPMYRRKAGVSRDFAGALSDPSPPPLTPSCPLRFRYGKKEPFRSCAISANELEDVARGSETNVKSPTVAVHSICAELRTNSPAKPP